YGAVRAGNSRGAHRASGDARADHGIWRERIGRGRRDRAAGGDRQRRRRRLSRYRRELQRDAADPAPGCGSDRAGAAHARCARMKPAPFDYVAPKTVAEASAALALDGATTAAIAGGQSLLPMLNLRVALPDLLVDLGGLQELKEVAATSDNIRIGALTTHAAIEDGKLPDAFGGLLQKVAAKISYRAIRNHGTIGGSVALADP